MCEPHTLPPYIQEGANLYLQLCDKVRDDVLPALGVRLEDRTDGSFLWKLDDPEVTMDAF